MMEELKTLIDIQLLNCNLEEANRVGHLSWFRKELKTEAIRWIKELRDNNRRYNEKYFDFQDSGYGEYTNDRYGAIINWIKHFFKMDEIEQK